MFLDLEDPRPTVILVLGLNTVDKSSFSRDLARQLPKCACVEVDELRYKVFGGLVSHSRGVHPDQAPLEFILQCEMASRNALLLASGFAECGFSSVIDGLEEGYARRLSWLISQTPSAHIITVGLYCDLLTLQERRAQRGWPQKLPDGIEQKLAWYGSNSGGFDCVISTDSGDIDWNFSDYVTLPISNRNALLADFRFLPEMVGPLKQWLPK